MLLLQIRSVRGKCSNTLTPLSHLFSSPPLAVCQIMVDSILHHVRVMWEWPVFNIKQWSGLLFSTNKTFRWVICQSRQEKEKLFKKINLYFYVIFANSLPKYAAGPEPEPHHSCHIGKTALQCQAVRSPVSPVAVSVQPRSPNPPGTTQNCTATTLAAAGPPIPGLPIPGLPLHINLPSHKQRASTPPVSLLGLERSFIWLYSFSCKTPSFG